MAVAAIHALDTRPERLSDLAVGKPKCSHAYVPDTRVPGDAVMQALGRLLRRVGVYDAVKPWHERLGAVRQRVHQRRTVRLYARFVNPGGLCFDVGANVGSRTDAMRSLGAKVVVVEPQPSLLEVLRQRFAGDPNVVIVPKALGESEGTAELFLGEAHTLATMSQEWIRTVQRSGRFASHRWSDRLAVAVTTLDRLIADFGRPSFCKIDVEGFELQVLRGLHQPIPVISFEFTPEHLHRTLECIAHLNALGAAEFNYSIGETMRLALSRWVGAEEISVALRSVNSRTFGDVYVRFET